MRAKMQVASFENNDMVPHDRIDAARLLGADVIRAVDARAAIIKSTIAIDRDFAIPAANWEQSTSDYMNVYRLLASLEWNEMKLLRLRSGNFTGNSLITMGLSEGLHAADPIPDRFEDRWPNRCHALMTHWSALAADVPDRLIFRPPNVLGETGWRDGETIVNPDTIDYQERINLLARSGLINRFAGRAPRILEIGGGYGALALALTGIMEPSQYVICDLPESLLFSGMYLALAQSSPVRIATPSRGLSPSAKSEICLLPNYLAQPLLAGERFDLVINTLSMSEMTPHQVTIYGRLISAAIGDTGAFFEQNRSCRDLVRIAPFSRSGPVNLFAIRGIPRPKHSVIGGEAARILAKIARVFSGCSVIRPWNGIYIKVVRGGRDRAFRGFRSDDTALRELNRFVYLGTAGSACARDCRRGSRQSRRSLRRRLSCLHCYWGDIPVICYGRSSRRDRFYRVDGFGLVSLERDATDGVAAQHHCRSILDLAVQSRELGGLD
jgi:hypothetical protein